MCTTKRGTWTAALLTAAVVITTTGPGGQPSPAQQRVGQPEGRRVPANEVQGVVKAIDLGKGSLTIATGGRGEEPGEKTFTLGKSAEVALGGRVSGAAGLREGKLADLAVGALVRLQLSADGKEVQFIQAEGPTLRGSIKTVDAGKGTITVSVPLNRREEPTTEEKTLTLGKKAEIAIDDGRGKIFSIKEAKLADLPIGAVTAVTLAADLQHVVSVLVEGRTIFGIVKSVDAGKGQVTLTTRPGRGDVGPEEQTYTVTPGTDVLLDEGKSRHFLLHEGQLADLPVGAGAALRLSPDQKTVVFIVAEGPSVRGPVRALDAGKNTITVVTKMSRDGNPEEEKTYSMARDVRVIIDGKESKLADVKVDEKGPPVGLKLSLDQKVVQSIIAGSGGRGR